MPRSAKPYAIAAASVLAVTLVRWSLDSVLEHRHVFSVFYAAVAISAWYGGLRPALLALCCGWIAAEWFFVEPRRSFSPLDHETVLATLTYVLVGGAILASIEGIRRASQRTVPVAVETSELQAVANAIRTHRINSRELVAYLEGLNAGPETFLAAAQYEDFDLGPDELAERFEALARSQQQLPATSV
jgi:K+-sensing histidine kinase KdpD